VIHSDVTVKLSIGVKVHDRFRVLAELTSHIKFLVRDKISI
jgi:hypothetical protein